jgi:hypothetical protein
VKSIRNLTRTFLKISLPGGKVLRLGPGKTGQIADHAHELPSVKKLLEAGQIEIVSEGAQRETGGYFGGGAQASTAAHHPRNKGRSSGDR